MDESVGLRDGKAGSLTWEVLKTVFPVPPSERRARPELYGDLVPAGLRDDEAFYSALLERIRSDRGYLQRLEHIYASSTRQKVRGRSFVARGWRWVRAHHPGIGLHELLDDSQETFLEGTIERDLEELMILATRQDLPCIPAVSDSGAELAKALTEVQSLAARLESPSVAEVDQLIEGCRLLRELVAARESRAAEKELRMVAESRDRLRQELATWASMDVVSTFLSGLEGLDRSSLSSVEARLEDAIIPALKDLDAAIRQKSALTDELSRATAGTDWAGVAKVGVKLQTLESELTRLGEVVEEFLGGNPSAMPRAESTSTLTEPVEARAGDDGSVEMPIAPKAADSREAELLGREPADSETVFVEADAPEPPVTQELVVTGSADSDLAKLEESGEELEAERGEPETAAMAGQPAQAQVQPEVVGPTLGQGQDPNAAIIKYLASGQDALAWHLARLVDPEQLEIPASVLRSLAISPCVSGPYQNASSHIGEAFAESMEDLKRFEQLGKPSAGAVRMLLFASMLRPAVLAPLSSARQHLQVLSMTGEPAPLAKLKQELSSLGHGFAPHVNDLRELAGTERSRRAPNAQQALREWLQRAEGATSLHQPTTMIFHGMLKDSGQFGSLVQGIIDDRLDAPTRVDEWVQAYLSNKPAVEALVGELEKMSGRPGKDAITGKAMDWICRKVQEGTELLADWLDAHRSDRKLLDAGSRRAWLPKVTHLEKLVSSALDSWTKSEESSGLDRVMRERVAIALQQLGELVSGAEDRPPQRVSDTLNMPLRLLPAVCIPRVGDFERSSEFAGERAKQEQALLDALLSQADSLDQSYQAALRARLKEGAVLAAREIMGYLQANGALDAEELALAADEWQDTLDRERRKLLDEVEAVRLGLSTLYNLDLSNGEELRAALETADALALAAAADAEQGEDTVVTLPAGDERRAGVPADFPEARELLSQMRGLQRRVEEVIRRDQHERLAQIASDRPEMRESIEAIMPQLAHRDPTAVEDLVASLQAGQAIATIEDGAKDVFQEFFPEFVEALSEAKLNKGQVDAALQEGAALAPLDFSGLDEDMRQAGRQLLVAWRQVDNSHSKQGREWRAPVVAVLEGLGFTSVKLAADAIPVTRQLRSTSFSSEVPASDGWFLPPEFGTLARGHYRLYLCRPEQDFRGIVDEMVKGASDAPAVVLMFGVLSTTRRREFARTMRSGRQRAILVDEAQVLFLVGRGSARLQTLVECGAPFGYVQPYTTDPGNIPKEMFFGRKEEIAKIYARSADGCLVYGGRQLGKSALLNHVRKIFHAPTAGQMVCYRSCDSLGLDSEPAAYVWRIMAQELGSEIDFPKGLIDPRQFCEVVEEWIEEDPNRRILMLLDETDNFMSSEARLGYPNLTRLKELMVRSDWRFKVVFAGLHNVRRAWKAPNTPLAHLGEPICVGPLSTSAENRSEARRLVVDPIRAAGFEFERPEIGWDILARVNHYPSLVQVFCKELLAELHREKLDDGPDGPRWRVSRAMVFEGARYRRINEAIRSKFRLTLDLDRRYDLIANVLALYRFEEGDHPVLRHGLSVPDLYQQVLKNWPESLERLRTEEFRAILDEMVDLGVLSVLGQRGDRYGLRTAQVAHMLGTKDEVETQLLHIMEMEPRVDYDAALFFRRLDPESPARRAILSDAQLDALFRSDRGEVSSRVVVAANGHDASLAAEEIAEAGKFWVGGSVPRVAEVHTGDRSGFREALRRTGRADVAGALLVISSLSGWEQSWMDWADEQPEVRRGLVIPVFVATTRGYWEAGGRPWGEREVYIPKPWGDQMLRAWLAECDGTMLDHAARRQRILAGTGGLPARVIKATSHFSRSARAGGVDVTQLLEEWEDAQRVSFEEVGIPEELAPLVEMVDDLEGTDDVDSFLELACDVMPEAGIDGVNRGLKVLEDLGVLELGGARLRVSPLGRLLKRSVEG